MRTLERRMRRGGAMPCIETLERRRLLTAWLDHNVGTFTDADGDQYTVRLSGPGQVAVTQVDPDLDGRGPIDAIAVEATDWKRSSLSITVKSGTPGVTPSVEINQLTGTALKAFSARNCDVIGLGIDINGFLGNIMLHALRNGAGILAHGNNEQFSSITIGSVSAGSQIDLHSQIRKLTAGNLDECTIIATGIGSLIVTGNCHADLVISGSNVPGGMALKSAKVAGRLENCTWSVASGNVGPITAGEVDSWTAAMGGSSIKALKTTGSAALNICGDFVGDVTAVSIGSVSVRCFLMQSTFALSRAPSAGAMALGTLRANGWMEDTRIQSVGNIGNITVQAMDSSTIFAGVTTTHDYDGDGVLDLPNPHTELALGVGRASIGNIKVLRDPLEDFSIINCNIAAAQVGTYLLNYVKTSNNGVATGLVADLLKALIVKYEGGGLTIRNSDVPSDSHSEGDWYMVIV